MIKLPELNRALSELQERLIAEKINSREDLNSYFQA